MAMGRSGASGGRSSDMNLTPLIDVLLVLLIIFMVIVPVTPKGLDALLPQPPRQPEGDGRPIVVQVLSRGGGGAAYKINHDDVSKADLLPKLQGIFVSRAERVMFVRGDQSLDFAQVAEVVDIGHAAGVDHIGMITPKIEAGQ